MEYIGYPKSTQRYKVNIVNKQRSLSGVMVGHWLYTELETLLFIADAQNLFLKVGEE